MAHSRQRELQAQEAQEEPEAQEAQEAQEEREAQEAQEAQDAREGTAASFLHWEVCEPQSHEQQPQCVRNGLLPLQQVGRR